MKNIFNEFNMCLSMFSIFPTLKYKWDEKKRLSMLSYLPIIGLIIGFVWYILYLIFNIIIIKHFIYIASLFISICPLFASGFIHLDGFLDVVDSISSNKDINTKKKILKDSSVGAFAVIYLLIILLINYISSYVFLLSDSKMICYILIFIPFYSRYMSLYFFNHIKILNISEYNKHSNNKNSRIFLFIVITAIMLLFNVKFMYIIAIEIIAYIISIYVCFKNFNGINGDCSGFSIVVSEGVAMLALAIISNI